MKIKRPIIFFDLETTGVSVTSDRIIQIGAIKVFPDGSQDEKNVLINPTIPIPESASEVHGIYDKDVENAPLFRQISKSMLVWFEGCDLAGYNSDNFDIPMLSEEFRRVGISYPSLDVNFIDVLKIERIVNSHKLEETYKRYTGEDLDGAHDAMIDIEATREVFFRQIEKYADLPETIKGIEEMLSEGKKRIDISGKIYERDGVTYWNFGKNKDTPVLSDRNYCDWVLRSDFPSDTKDFIRKLLSV